MISTMIDDDGLAGRATKREHPGDPETAKAVTCSYAESPMQRPSGYLESIVVSAALVQQNPQITLFAALAQQNPYTLAVSSAALVQQNPQITLFAALAQQNPHTLAVSSAALAQQNPQSSALFAALAQQNPQIAQLAAHAQLILIAPQKGSKGGLNGSKGVLNGKSALNLKCDEQFLYILKREFFSQKMASSRRHSGTNWSRIQASDLK